MDRMNALSLPSVTIVVPARNEARHIDRCLESLQSQSYPSAKLEIIVVDGESTDATRELVARWSAREPRIRLLSNPRRSTPDALNIGIRAATSDLIGCVSGHSRVGSDYVERATAALAATGASSVGGRIVRLGETSWQRAVAVATGSPLGVGDSRHNYATTAQWVESVFPGFWRRDLFDRIGLFDVTMVANEDNELSERIRKSGGRIWYDPSIVIEYVPRGGLKQLFNQYRRYAFGKARVFRKHSGAARCRHFVPSAWLVVVFGGGGLAALLPPFRVPWLVIVLAYLVTIAGGAARISRGQASWWRTAAALVTLHLAYGLGMLQGLVAGVVHR